MLGIQDICNIAMRHVGHVIADATIAACIQAAYRDGFGLVIVWPDDAAQEQFRASAERRTTIDATSAEWRRYVERNGDTRWNHL